MEVRIARLESDVAHMRTDIADIKSGRWLLRLAIALTVVIYAALVLGLGRH